ncbi:BlaI/MecI/CopY family transcriptional regulator [Streptomyces sp. NPDC090306]|uniref:BlaI/MecI/CopY family transcriptional regulator n=1 Tax=Streptomyces sp. NPDC090306 TaxID=3365961 RepID=UPI00381743EA
MTEENGGRRPAGDLEASVLAVLWAADRALSAHEVRAALDSGLARTTVTTILTRLQQKGAVSRRRSGRGFAYAPTAGPAGLTARRMHAELDSEQDRGSVLAHFISALGAEDERLLRELLDRADEQGEDADRPGPHDAPDPGQGPRREPHPESRS